MNTVAVLSSNSKALWYLTRGFGLVALLLLTLTTVLGLLQVVRYSRPGIPRFVISALHKNASLLAVSAIAVHVLTALLDSYAPIHLVDVVVPLASKYRPFWTGLGALAFDLLLAVIVTSLFRQRLGHRTWRAIHWAAYGSWPAALVHGLGTGSDPKLGWVLFLYVICVASVIGALWWRLGRGWTPANSVPRGLAASVTVVLPLVVTIWALSGPLKPGWARKAGTPAALLGSSNAVAAAPSSAGAASSVPSGPSTGPSSTTFHVPFTSQFSGQQHETRPDSNGLVSVILSCNLTSGTSGTLKLVLTGYPIDDGGVSLTGSQVQLGPSGDPTAYRGHVTQLAGGTVIAVLQDSRGDAATATIDLQLQGDGSGVAGSLRLQ
jgi:sulfoxide reductase heme-binding subunit YedZ